MRVSALQIAHSPSPTSANEQARKPSYPLPTGEEESSLPRPDKGRQSPFAFVEHKHPTCGRRAALGAIGAGAGAAAQADGGGFSCCQVYPARGGEWGGELRVQPQPYGKFGADAAFPARLRLHGARDGEPAGGIFQLYQILHQLSGTVKCGVQPP